jgi:uncharacterized membrane protein YoaK (UPF0700 family)
MADDPKPRRIDDPMLVALSFSGGAVDAISWLAFSKVFSAFMTGNFAFLGFVLAGAGGPPATSTLAAIAAFAVGAAVGGRLVAPHAAGGRDPYPVTTALCIVVLAQAAFLVMWLVVGGRPSGAGVNAMIAVSAFSMGVQSAAVFALGRRVVFTTAVTATLTVLMGDLATWSRSDPQERRRLAGVIVALFVGAVCGAWLMVHARDWAPVLPLAVTAAVVAAAVIRERPRHAVSEPTESRQGRPQTQ